MVIKPCYNLEVPALTKLTNHFTKLTKESTEKQNTPGNKRQGTGKQFHFLSGICSIKPS